MYERRRWKAFTGAAVGTGVTVIDTAQYAPARGPTTPRDAAIGGAAAADSLRSGRYAVVVLDEADDDFARYYHGSDAGVVAFFERSTGALSLASCDL